MSEERSIEAICADLRVVHQQLCVMSELGKLELGDDAGIHVAIVARSATGTLGRVLGQMDGPSFLADLGRLIGARPLDAAAVAARVAKEGPESVKAMIALGILSSVIADALECESSVASESPEESSIEEPSLPEQP